MKKEKILRRIFSFGIFFIVGYLFPQQVFAESCLATGYTIEYVNGVSDTFLEAEANQVRLQKILGDDHKGQSLVVKLAYNQEHLAGVADVVQAISQMLFAPISDYDMHTVLRQMATDDTTRKLLLVGHSQGALYANSIYNYLVAHGEPARALDIYAVATPANYVAGGGKYINSYEDAVIISSGLLAKKLDVPTPLPPNVSMVGSLSLGALSTTHLFTTYLNGAPDRMVAEINSQLDALQGDMAFDTISCFTPPPVTFGDQVQQSVFAVADPTANAARTGVVVAYQGTALAVIAAVAIAHASYAAVTSAFGSVVALVSNPKINPAAPENQGNNFTVVKKLYGSSLDQAGYDELNSNQGGAAITAFISTKPPDVNNSVPEPPTIIATTTVPVPPAPPVPLVVVATTTKPVATTTAVILGGSALPPPVVVVVATTTAITTPIVNIFNASTTPPVLTVAECASSLNTNFCLISTTTATLSWTAVTDAVYYGIQINGTETATTTGTQFVLVLTDHATTTLGIVAYDQQSSTSTSVTQAVTVAVPVPAVVVPISTISDTFDTFNSAGWQDIGGFSKNFEADDDPTLNCFHNGCAVGSANNVYTTQIPIMYIETSPGLSAGAYTVYARARQNNINSANPAPSIYVCQEGDVACADQGSVRGLNFRRTIPLDDTWHQYYIAWRQGSSVVESCLMQDDTNPADCSWQDTRANATFPLGTTFDGIVFSAENGYRADLGANVWFDELVPH